MKLSVVIPCKNQSAVLFENIEKIGIPYFDSLKVKYEFLLVLDGSDEENMKLAKEKMKKMPKQIKLVDYESKLGKGHNVQHGFNVAKGDYILFMDADFATDLHVMETILPEIDQYDGFIASRRCKGAKIMNKQTVLRRIVSWMSRLLIKMSFGFKYKETQCGFKLFRKDLAKILAKKQIIDGFAFDVEYLYFCKLNGFKIKEVPCIWNDGEKSTIKHAGSTSMNFIKDMKRIKKNKKNYILTNDERKSLGLEVKEA